MRKEHLIEKRFVNKPGESNSEAEESYIKHNFTSLKNTLIKQLSESPEFTRLVKPSQALRDAIAANAEKVAEVDTRTENRRHLEALEKINERSLLAEDITEDKLDSEQPIKDTQADKLEERIDKKKERWIAQENKLHERNLNTIEQNKLSTISKEIDRLNKKSIYDKVEQFLESDRLNPMNLDDRVTSLIRNKYLNYMYKIVEYTKGREYRNNKIIDMSWAVLTHEAHANEILNPGGFDLLKRMGYMAEAKRLNPEMSLAYLRSLSINLLKDLCYTTKNLSFIDTHILFYKLNAAAGTILGMFAVLKVAHAVLESNGIQLNVDAECNLPTKPVKDERGNTLIDEDGIAIEAPIRFNILDKEFGGLMTLDSKVDDEGLLIGKTLGSLVASAADAVKDPVLNLMNINSLTANVLNSLIRLGMTFDKAALFLSLKCITNMLELLSSLSIERNTSLSKVINERIKTLESEYGYKDSDIITEGLNEEELEQGLVEPTVEIEYKTLKYYLYLSKIANAVKGPSFATRFNSISAAVGPLVVDNLITEHKMDLLSENLYTALASMLEDGTVIGNRIYSMLDIFDMHPIINGFSKGVDIAKLLLRDMPSNSRGFRNILESMEKDVADIFYSDRKLLTLLSDFYQSYMLVANDGINKICDIAGISQNQRSLDYFINQFPKDFIVGKAKERYKDNLLIQAIKQKVTKEDKRAYLLIDTVGVDATYKDKLSSAWTDLHRVNPKLSTMLFLYNFYRTGTAFSPKSFINLMSTNLKESKEFKPYIDTYRRFPETVYSIVLDLFIRNNWDNNRLVPTISKETNYTYSLNNGLELYTIKKKNSLDTKTDIDYYSKKDYVKLKTDKGVKLLKQVTSDKSYVVYRVIDALGNNGMYLEMSNNFIEKALESSNRPKEESTPNEIKAPSDSQVTSELIEDAPMTDLETTDLIIKIFQTEGTSRQQAEAKVTRTKQIIKQSPNTYKLGYMNFIEKQLNKLGIPHNQLTVEDLYKKLC